MTGNSPLRATQSHNLALPRGTGSTRRALLAAAVAIATTLTITGDTMSYATDDLTPMFAPQPAPGVGYRKGTVVAWNPDTAQNQVEVDGALVDDLPILNTSEALLLQPGDAVGILTTGGASGSWCILGRLTIPGTPAAATALDSIGTITAEVLAQHSTNSTNWIDLTGGPSITVNVRPSGRVLILYSAQIGWAIGAPGAVSGLAGIDVSGANTFALTGTAPSDRRIRVHVEVGGATTNTAIVAGGSQKMFTGLNPGETTFKLRYRSVFGQSVDFDNRAITAILL